MSVTKSTGRVAAGGSVSSAVGFGSAPHAMLAAQQATRVAAQKTRVFADRFADGRRVAIFVGVFVGP
jgi:hypothetical protein